MIGSISSFPWNALSYDSLLSSPWSASMAASLYDSGSALGSSSQLGFDPVTQALSALDQTYTGEASLAQQQVSLEQSLQTKTQTLDDAANALSSASLFDTQSSVTSSDSSVLTASATAGGTLVAGGYTVSASQLAVDEVQQQSSTITQAGNSDTLTLSVATLSGTQSTQVQIAAGDSLQTIADEINAADAGTSASVVNGKLQFDTAGQLTVTGGGQSNGYDLATDLGLTTTQAHSVAQLTVNGVSQSSDTNTVSDAVPGVTLDLLAPGTTTVSVSQPTANADAVVSAVQSFVSAYNDLYGSISSATATPLPGTDPSTAPFADDLILSQTGDQLQQAVSDSVDGLSSSSLQSFSQIGLTTSGGMLTLNEQTLRNELASNPDQVQQLLQQVGSDSSSSGLGPRVADLANSLLDGNVFGQIGADAAATLESTQQLSNSLDYAAGVAAEGQNAALLASQQELAAYSSDGMLLSDSGLLSGSQLSLYG